MDPLALPAGRRTDLRDLNRLPLVVHSSTFRFLILTALLIPPGANARAQSPGVRTSLDRFQDSLNLITDPARLGALSRETRRAANEHQDVATVLRQAYVLFRRAEIEDGRLFDQARNGFRRASVLRPDWPYPIMGVGYAERKKGDWLAAEPGNLGIRVGFGSYEAAVRAFLTASSLDPSLWDPLRELDRLAGILRDTSITRQVLLALRTAGQRSQEPALHLALGRYERLMGDLPNALAAFERYARSGDNPPLADAELAHTLIASGDSGSESLYFRAARSGDSVTIAVIRADLTSIFSDEELARYDEARGADRESFLREFWRDRARQDLRSPVERMREHFRRLRFARLNFPDAANRRVNRLEHLYRFSLAEVDDRGRVYIRHGEPATRVAPPIFGAVPNETWVYRRADGDLMMHFGAGRLVPSLLSLGGSDVPTDLLLLSRSELSVLYDRIMAWGPHGAASAAREERELGTMSAALGVSTDAFELRFLNPLRAWTDLVTVGYRGDRALVHLIYTFAAEEDSNARETRVRLNLSDSSGRSVGWIDTTHSAIRVAPGLLGGRIVVEAPPGSWTYRLSIESGQSGMVTPLGGITVPFGSSGTLAISDIVLGQSEQNIPWIMADADTAWVSPLDQFAEGGRLQLSYELYGTLPGQDYATSLAIADRGRGGKVGRSRLRFSFRENHRGGTTRVHRTLILTGLKPGDYWLQVRVEPPNGPPIHRQKAIRVRPQRE